MGNIFRLVLSGIVLFALNLPLISSAYTVDLYSFTGDDAHVQITIEGDGTSSIDFTVEVKNPAYADISGIWFNFNPYPTAPENISVTGDDVTDFNIEELGATLEGLNINGEGYTSTDWNSVIKIGLSGIRGDDDFYSTSFTVASFNEPLESLSLGDLFAVRLTSVGTGEDVRVGSSKLVGGAPVPEPATMLLFGVGLAGIAGISRRKKK